MLNLHDLCRLLMLPIGAFTGYVSAAANKTGILAAVLLTVCGLLFAIGLCFASFHLERRLNRFPARVQPVIYLTMPFAGLLAAFLLPVLFTLIIYGHK